MQTWFEYIFSISCVMWNRSHICKHNLSTNKVQIKISQSRIFQFALNLLCQWWSFSLSLWCTFFWVGACGQAFKADHRALMATISHCTAIPDLGFCGKSYDSRVEPDHHLSSWHDLCRKFCINVFKQNISPKCLWKWELDEWSPSLSDCQG